MTSDKNEWKKIHLRYGFFLGFCAAVLSLIFLIILTVVLWLPCRWLDQMGISNRQVMFFLSTIGLSQWLYVIPSACFLWKKNWFGLCWGLLAGATFLFILNSAAFAYMIYGFHR